MTIEEFTTELDFLRIKRRKLSNQIDDVDTEMIGLKEQIRKLKENDQKTSQGDS